MSNNPLDSNKFPGRRRGVPQEKDTYAYKEHPAKVAKRAEEASHADQKKMHNAWIARATFIVRNSDRKGFCPICGVPITKGISGHVYAHVRHGEADQWQPTEKSKTEST